MRRYLSLVLMAVLLVTAGCVEEPPTTANVTTTKTTVVTTVPVTTVAATPAPVPEAMAYISGITCGVGDRSDDAYHCNGDVRIRSGISGEVTVITRYADRNTFKSNTVSLGGGDESVLKPFVIFPDLKYKSQTPAYFVKIDDTIYVVKWNGKTGIAWSNTPGAEDVVLK